jgi:hypothetical protein
MIDENRQGIFRGGGESPVGPLYLDVKPMVDWKTNEAIQKAPYADHPDRP